MVIHQTTNNKTVGKFGGRWATDIDTDTDGPFSFHINKERNMLNRIHNFCNTVTNGLLLMISTIGIGIIFLTIIIFVKEFITYIG